MIITRVLDSKKLIEDACALLYEVYIKNGQWNFSADNPSQLMVKTKKKKKLLFDRFTNRAIWFGAFDNQRLVGCIRLCGVDDNNKFEIEGYPNSKIVHKYLPKSRNSCVEMTRAAVDNSYKGKNILNALFLISIKYCYENKYSIFGSASNPYVKALLKRIEFPLKVEQAFKHEPQDPKVNFYFASYKNGEIERMIKNLTDLEKHLKTKLYNIFEALELVAPILPAPVYWHNKDGVVLGINELCLQGMGTTREQIIGKTPYDFYPKEVAEHILKHNEKIMSSEEILSQEERIEDITTGKPRYFTSVKSPLYGDDGQVIGIVGTSIEITAEKEAEQLRSENEAKSKLLEQEVEFRKIVGQMVHDIESPLSSLQTIVQSTENIPENDRVILRTVAMNIADITNHMLERYKPEPTKREEQRQPMLVSATLLQIHSAKRYEYKGKSIKVEIVYDFKPNSNFSFIKIEPSSFKRAISNVMNNAVQAVQHKPDAKVTLTISSNTEWVIISIEDNGKGMPQKLVNKILANTPVTEGKEDGHGIGLTQVLDTLRRNLGKPNIYSTVGEGTKVMLFFPKIAAPNWIADGLKVNKDDTIIILDDDTSIHGAWNIRMQPFLEKNQNISVKHFADGLEAVEYINNLAIKDKRKIYLLTDYELLNQNLTGLDVIYQTGIKHSVLVTSHFDNQEVRKLAAKAHVKILPKSLVHAVPIKVNQKIKTGSKIVDMVWVDDEKGYVEHLISLYYKKLKVDTYNDPINFLDEVIQYPLNTRIILDNNFETGEYNINGIMLAKQLHDKGYTNILLLSGEEIQVDVEYLTTISKGDINSLMKLDRL